MDPEFTGLFYMIFFGKYGVVDMQEKAFWIHSLLHLILNHSFINGCVQIVWSVDLL